MGGGGGGSFPRVIFGSSGHKKVPQTGWLKHRYVSSVILEVRKLKSR